MTAVTTVETAFVDGRRLALASSGVCVELVGDIPADLTTLFEADQDDRAWRLSGLGIEWRRGGAVVDAASAAVERVAVPFLVIAMALAAFALLLPGAQRAPYSPRIAALALIVSTIVGGALHELGHAVVLQRF